MTCRGVLAMEDVANWIFGIFVVAGLLYLVFLRPKFEAKRDNQEFDNLVLGFIDGLYFSGMELGCSGSEIRQYVEAQLFKAHQLPGNECLIKYTTKDERIYCSWTGRNDANLFALLCVAAYAREHGQANLVAWCESKMAQASRPAHW